MLVSFEIRSIRITLHPIYHLFILIYLTTLHFRFFSSHILPRNVFLCGADDNALGKISASWSKFSALTDLLEYSLSEVAEWLPR